MSDGKLFGRNLEISAVPFSVFQESVKGLSAPERFL